jgi:predicted RNA-binding Zn-ribbon protein involved in translation (DUF1610 family)
VTHQAIIKTCDIETLPHQVYTWGLFKQNVGLNQIIVNAALASACFKTLGAKSTRYFDNRDAANGAYDDRELMGFIHEELSNVDIVVWQNGVKFDSRKINARFIELGMPPVPAFKSVDTMLHAKQLAMFTSNRLEWLSAHLTDAPKSKHVKFPGFELWKGIIANAPGAWEEMEKYNRQDVIATEKLYLKLRPYMRQHPNVNVYDDSEVLRCPSCGSSHLIKRGISVTQVGQFQRYQCKGCGSWSSERMPMNSKAKRNSLLKS